MSLGDRKRQNVMEYYSLMEIIKKQAADEVEQAEDDNQYFSMKMKDYMGINVKVARI